MSSETGLVPSGAKRIMRSTDERRRIVEETLRPGASVARVARAHGVNANQVFTWRRLMKRGKLEPAGQTAAQTFLPVHVRDASQQRTAAGMLHVETHNGRLLIDGTPDLASLNAVLDRLFR